MKHVVRGGWIACFDRLLELRHANFEVTVSHEQESDGAAKPPQQNAPNGTSRSRAWRSEFRAEDRRDLPASPRGRQTPPWTRNRMELGALVASVWASKTRRRRPDQVFSGVRVVRLWKMGQPEGLPGGSCLPC